VETLTIPGPVAMSDTAVLVLQPRRSWIARAWLRVASPLGFTPARKAAASELRTFLHTWIDQKDITAALAHVDISKLTGRAPKVLISADVSSLVVDQSLGGQLASPDEWRRVAYQFLQTFLLNEHGSLQRPHPFVVDVQNPVAFVEPLSTFVGPPITDLVVGPQDLETELYLEGGSKITTRRRSAQARLVSAGPP
jgi:hypothetical protein